MKYIYTAFSAALICATSFFFFHKSSNAKLPVHTGDPMEDDALARMKWEYKRLAGPDGTIPADMREKELAFAATLPSDASLHAADARMQSASWDLRGPWNVGGRTRAFAIDVMNENHFIAGSVSGAIWSSNDAGQTWTNLTPTLSYHGVTGIIQDKRPGHTDTWYAISGEPYGQSASAGGNAYFLGNGMLKSLDNGQTWTALAATVSGTPQSFDNFWDLEWDIALDQHDTVNNVAYTACLGAIYRTMNGGTSWTTVRGGSFSSYSYFTDVAVTKDSGIVYATLSSDGPQRGIWRSVNQGTSWTKISTPMFGDSLCNLVVMGINPSNENELYFLGNTNGIGMPDTNFQGDIEYDVLWRYTYLGGDGSGAGGMWEDLSQNLPNSEHFGTFGDFNAQGSYNLTVAVKPDDPNTVFIGGTNIYRNTNRFNDTSSTKYIGGYLPYTTLPIVLSYTNHHPDQHVLAFLPSNPNVMFNGNDGGIFRTDDCTASNVSWNSLNNGYLTTQFYTVTVDHSTTDDIVTGGAQDNGSWWTNNTTLATPWVQPHGGDGSFCAIEDGGGMYYYSIQLGKVYKATLDVSGNVTGVRRIDPIGGKNYQFINPFALDPNNQHIMYLAGGKYLWRNDDLSAIPLSNQYDSISTNWVKWNDSVPTANSLITAVAVCKTPANRVYYGTDRKRIYRVDNANTGTPTPVDITGSIFPASGFVNCIAVNPNDGNQVLVVFSNYSVYSLWYSSDGGTTWQKCAGNLEQNSSGTGNGPSLRWASFLPVSDGMIYLVSTSAGLYATDTLQGLATWWVRQGDNTIGTIVCDMTDVRANDGLVVVATHSGGIFSTHLTSVNDVAAVHDVTASTLHTNIFPNPSNDFVNVTYSLNSSADMQLILLDEEGRILKKISSGKKSPGSYTDQLDVHGYAAGIYYVRLTAGAIVETKPLVISR